MSQIRTLLAGIRSGAERRTLAAVEFDDALAYGLGLATYVLAVLLGGGVPVAIGIGLFETLVVAVPLVVAGGTVLLVGSIALSFKVVADAVYVGTRARNRFAEGSREDPSVVNP